MVRHRLGRVGRLLPLLGVLAFLVWAAPVLGQTEHGEWRSYHGDKKGTRYSPLDQITRENAGDLEIAWQWRMDNFGNRLEAKSEVTPLMANGVLYAQAGYRRAVVAIDAGTGETLWMWRMDEGERGEMAPRRNSGRGVAYWTDGTNERIYTVTPGFQLVALDAKTGVPIAGFGENGVVDMMRDWDGSVHPLGNIGSSSPVMVTGNRVIVPPALRSGGAPPTKENTPGHVAAYDANTGARVWTFHTVPQSESEFGWDTWEDNSASYTGNAGSWAPISVDEELGYAYLPIEDATGDYYGGHRPGDNLFAATLVCVDIETGERVWHFQMIHHDIWDYDNPTAPILLDVTVEGQPRKIVVQLTKQGFAYVFDRVTGEPIWPIEERPVSQSDVPGEQTSPTQPFPTKPAPYDHQGVTLDNLIDFTPALRAEALESLTGFRWGPLYSPPSLAEALDGTRGTTWAPTAGGASLWEHAAADPETGILYVPSNGGVGILALTHDPERSNMRYIISRGARLQGPQGLPLLKPPYGRITAIDMNTGEHLWVIPNGDTPERIANHPALQGLDIPPTGNSSKAGLVVTKTLLFGGEGWRGRPIFRAYDKQTGETLVEIDLPATQTSQPMTYMHEGRQYIVFTVGGGEDAAAFVALTVPPPVDVEDGGGGGPGQ